MRTAEATSPTRSHQLCFVWQDAPQVDTSPKKRSAGKSSQEWPKATKQPQAHPISTPVERVSISPTAKRVGEPQHIGGLMEAVLARYGIDPKEFLSHLES